MPIYSYRCPKCGWAGDLHAPVDLRDEHYCVSCETHMNRLVAAPLFRFAGRTTNGGGPDKFTADMLRIPVKDLPEGLRTK